MAGAGNTSRRAPGIASAMRVMVLSGAWVLLAGDQQRRHGDAGEVGAAVEGGEAAERFAVGGSGDHGHGGGGLSAP